MKMEFVKELIGGATIFFVRKIVYCDVYIFLGCIWRFLNIYGDVEMKNGVCRKESLVKTVRFVFKVRKKVKKVKKIMSEFCAVLSFVCVSYIFF